MTTTHTSLLAKRLMKSAASPLARWRWACMRDNQVFIVGYHRIAADLARAEHEAISGLVTSTETFTRHLQLLAGAFQVISLDAAVSVLRGERRLSRPAAVITFDDGYADAYEQAFPVLRRLGLPATVFLPTKYIGTDELLPHDRLYWLFLQLAQQPDVCREILVQVTLTEAQRQPLQQARTPLEQSAAAVNLPARARARLVAALERAVNPAQHPYPSGYRLLNWAQIAEMSEQGITFGGHSDTHPVLTLERQSAAVQEIFDNYLTLRQHLGARQFHFAYPNGQHNAALRQAAEDAGFASALTTRPAINVTGTDLYALGRTCFAEESTRGLSGHYAPGVARLRLGYRRAAVPRQPSFISRLAQRLAYRYTPAVTALLSAASME